MILRLAVGLLVAVAAVTLFFALRLQFAASVALAGVLGIVTGDAVEARQKRRRFRWSAALAQAVVVGGAIWVVLALLRG